MSEKTSRIPKFHSVADEAGFWDVHDLTEFEDELEEVDVQFVRPGQKALSVELDGEVLDELKAQARREKTRPSALASRLILDGLKRTKAS